VSRGCLEQAGTVRSRAAAQRAISSGSAQ
jgi:hypothetical protein